MSVKGKHLLPLLIVLIAFAARTWQLGGVPPGYSDDELSNALVLSQKIRDGQWTVYFTDASGHEALFHILVAGTMRLFGVNVLGLRLVSAFLGTLTVALTYQLGRRLFSRPVGLVAAAALAVSFWGLFYARVNQRHIAMPFFMMLTFVLFWWGLQRARRGRARANWLFAAAGVSLGLGYYTYFASRGVPLILVGLGLFLALFQRDLWRRAWRGLALTLAVSLLLALPLVMSLRAQADSGADARVEELAVPVTAARAGDFEPLRTHVVGTLGMFHARGDGEYLYNVPDRPVFGPIGAICFWSGLLYAIWLGVRPWTRRRGTPQARSRQRAAIFLLGWWLAGITPGFLSVPPASNSHTIAAQSATYLLAALCVTTLGRALRRRLAGPAGRWLALAPALLFLLLLGRRDLTAYFVEWPRLGQVRFLFHADMIDVADYVAANGLEDFGVTGLMFGPWDRLALTLALDAALPDAAQRAAAQPRWYNPERALLAGLEGAPAQNFYGYPEIVAGFATGQLGTGIDVGGYRYGPVNPEWIIPAAGERVCFANGLCWRAADYRPEDGLLTLAWEALRPLDLPPRPVVSKPPPPGVYDGPRLLVFTQLLAENGAFLTGDDGLWVDPAGLQAGDVFWQRHWLPLPDDQGVQIIIGLYDPLTGDRVLTTDGADYYRLPLDINP